MRVSRRRFLAGSAAAGLGLAGPLFADDPETAECLFDALASEAGGEVFVDPPFANDNALELFARKGLEPVCEKVRMYHGNTPRMRFPAMYGITTFELG